METLPEQAREALCFWFGDDKADEVDAARRRRWFAKDAAFDREVAERFGSLLEPARTGRLGWEQTPRGRLALILLLDQFARNIHRDSPAAFACDPAALALCLDGLEKGDDRSCGRYGRAFFYLPLEHAEDADCQRRSVELFRQLYSESPPEHRSVFASFLDYAVRHQEIIERFGRFPHRNEIFGRESTEAEGVFLEQPGSSF